MKKSSWQLKMHKATVKSLKQDVSKIKSCDEKKSVSPWKQKFEELSQMMGFNKQEVELVKPNDSFQEAINKFELKL